MASFHNQDQLRVHPTKVYTSTSFGIWTEHPNTRAHTLKRTSGAGIDSFNFSYDYGSISLHNAAAFATIAPLSWTGRFVRIRWVADEDNSGDVPAIYQEWFGVITDEIGDRDSPVQGAATGTQHFQCYGLEWLLTRIQIVKAYVQLVAGVSVKEIPFGIPFNGWRAAGNGEYHDFGNQANVPVGGAQCFADNVATARKWNSKDIVQYLMKYFAPHTAATLAWGLDTATATTNLLAWNEPLQMEVHGQTVFDVINAAIPRRAGLTWWLDVDGTAKTVTIRVASTNATAVVIPSGPTIPAATSIVNLDTAGITSGQIIQKVESAQKQYESVAIEGARRGSIVTVGYQDGTLVADWAEAARLSYNSGASTGPGYATADLNEQKRRNDAFRSTDVEAGRVFQNFRFPTTWDGWTGDGFTLGNIKPCHRPLNSNGDITGTPTDVAPFWNSGVEVERFIPMYEGVKYDNPSSPVETNVSGHARQFMRPFALIMLPNGERAFVDKLNSAAYLETSLGPGVHWACSVRPHDNQPGIVISPSVPAHVIAKDVFQPALSAPSDYIPQLSYQTLLATIYITFAEPLRISYPSIPNPARYETTSQLVIRVSKRAHLDYIPSDTIVRSGENDVVSCTSDAFIRDDRQSMRSLARTAFEFYSRPRRIAQLTVRAQSRLIKVGDLLGSLDSEAFNTIVSDVTLNFDNRTMSIRTDFGELDLGGLYDQV